MDNLISKCHKSPVKIDYDLVSKKHFYVCCKCGERCETEFKDKKVDDGKV